MGTGNASVGHYIDVWGGVGFIRRVQAARKKNKQTPLSPLLEWSVRPRFRLWLHSRNTELLLIYFKSGSSLIANVSLARKVG